MKKTFAWAIGALLVVAAGYGYWSYQRASQQTGLKFQTISVTRENLRAKVTTSGTLSALVTVQVGSQISGRIQQIFVDYNSKVSKGQLIAKIDPRMFQSAVEQANANALVAKSNLRKAEAQLAEASRQFARTQELANKNLIALAELDSAKANVETAQAMTGAAKASVEQARASLNQAKINLDYTSIVSPIDGMVISRNVDVGQTVAASLQAPVLFTIAEDLGKMQVNTNVSEADVGKLRPGMTADFTVDAFPGEHFQGKIRQVRNSPENVQNVVTYDAVIDLENPDLKLKPGMTANVTIVYAEQKNALVIPNAALRFRPSPEMLPLGKSKQSKKFARNKSGRSSRTDKKSLWVLRGQHPERIPVKVGISDGTKTEILEGELRKDDKVITDVSQGEDSSASPPQSRPRRGVRRLF